MERLTKRNDVTAYVNCDNCPSKGNCNIPQSCLEILANKLAAYENAEEQGRMVMLPCKVGDTLYEVDLPEYGVIVCKVIYMGYYSGPFAHVPGGKMVSTWTAGVEVVEGHGVGSSYAFDSMDFGKTVFLTREAAEAALQKPLDTSRRL